MLIRKCFMIYRQDENGALMLFPTLRLFIENAPHRRMDPEIISQYRKALREAFLANDILPPIRGYFDLWVTFINPTSPDLDNLIGALFRALDRYAPPPHFNNMGLTEDDSRIAHVTMGIMWMNQKDVGAIQPAATVNDLAVA